MRKDVTEGKKLIDLELPDHAGSVRRLSQITAEHPTFLNFYRGWW